MPKMLSCKNRPSFYLLRLSVCTSALLFSPDIFAQTVEKEAEPPADAPSSDARAARLEAQIAGLQAQLDDLKAQVKKTTPSWKGAPQFTDADEGWSFKVRGRLMLDGAYAGKPDNFVANRNLGFNTRVRRARLGVEGSVPGGFGYKAEADFANGAVGFGDVILTYAPTNKPFSLSLGNQETLNGMEQQSSSRWSSFIERAQINDAFNNTRRLGLTAGFKTSDNLFRADVGLFTAHSIDASVDNDGWIGAVRATYAPLIGNGFLHFGANYQHREFQSNNAGVASVSTGAPSTNQIARYRARPFLQTTDQRFVDTGNFAATGDDIIGVEVYGVFKSLHLGGEAQRVKVNTYAPGSIRTGRDAFTGGSVVTPLKDPVFSGGHFEVGYFLTGETRGYKNGLWDRTKVLKPFNKGGWGALQVIARYDYLDLEDNGVINGTTTNFATGAQTLASSASRQARGGTQTGYLVGFTWIPVDYVRILANYIRTDVTGGAFAAAAEPTSTDPIFKRGYSTDAFALRFQLDF
jgi:phosphate-selective porin OprO and OprP